VDAVDLELKRLLRKAGLNPGIVEAKERIKRACLRVVDSLDDPKHLLFDAFTLYNKGFTNEAVRLLRLAPRKAREIRERAILLEEAPPEVVTEGDIEYIRRRFDKIAKMMEERRDPVEIEDEVYDVDGWIYEKMFQNFHKCVTM